MKFYHNEHIPRGVAVVLAIGIHLLFGVGMYLLGSYIGSIVLFDVPHGDVIVGLLLSIIMFLGAMYSFIFLEYVKKDVRAFERKEGDGSYWGSLNWLQWLVAGMEGASLLYRCYKTLPNLVAAGITLALGILLLIFAFHLGKVIHAVANRPVSEEFKRVRNELDRDIVKDGLGYKDDMSYLEKLRLRNGDVKVIDEVRARKDKTLAASRAAEDRQREEDALADGAVSSMLSYPGAEKPSRNGAHAYMGSDDGFAGGGF